MAIRVTASSAECCSASAGLICVTGLLASEALFVLFKPIRAGWHRYRPDTGGVMSLPQWSTGDAA